MSSRTLLSKRVSSAGFAALALLFWPTLMGAEGCDPSGRPPVACPAIWAPVCGIDEVTYGNRCQADAAGVAVAYDGECLGGSCFCTEEYAPVCGLDGLTYSNGCFAACAGIPIAHRGECAPSCACPEIWAPVCGSDGVTYENECAASCAGAIALHPGACECAPVLCDLYCERGFERDPMTGCETCRCVEPEPTCVSDADCAMGTFCDASGCWGIDDGGMDPRDPTLPPVCLGLCRPIAPPPPDWCTSDAECGPGARCDLVECDAVCDPSGVCYTACHGVCVGTVPPPSDRCLADSDCRRGERCNTDECWSLCDPMSPDTACPAVCAGICEPIVAPPPPPPSCSSDADCAVEEHCELVWCMGVPCADGDPSCVGSCGGYCAPDVITPPPPPPPLPPCAADSDCRMGEYCSLPVCIWEVDCPTVGVCLPIDPGTEPGPRPVPLPADA